MTHRADNFNDIFEHDVNILGKCSADEFVGVVPYTGATSNVNLGSKTLTTTGEVRAGKLGLSAYDYIDTSTNHIFMSTWDGNNETNYVRVNLAGGFGGEGAAFYPTYTDTLYTAVDLGTETWPWNNCFFNDVTVNGTTTTDAIEIPSNGKIEFRDGEIYIYSNADGQMTLEADTKVNITANLSITGDQDFQLTKGIYWPETEDAYGQPYIKVDGDTMSIYGGYALNFDVSEQINFNQPCYFGSATNFSDEIRTTLGIYGNSINVSYSKDVDLDNNEVLSTGLGSGSNGLLLVSVYNSASNTNQSAIFNLGKVAGTMTLSLINQLGTDFTTTKDSAGKYNVYWETDQVKVQNKVGDNRVVNAGMLNAI